MTKRVLALLLSLLILFAFAASLGGCDMFADGREVAENGINENNGDRDEKENLAADGYASVEGIPDYSGKAYVALNNNVPEFTDSEKVTESYEFYSELDSLGRCGYTMACIGKDLMPTEDRESISSVKPSGWVNNKYDTELVDGGYIYNRCHLIGFQLTGENARKENLITGTRYLNIEGMLPFENMVADYVKETDNHVLYRVTPIFVGNNLVASGVKIEGWSVEDNGEGICFNVFAYNVQPGIYINYATGENRLADGKIPEDTEAPKADSGEGTAYVLNKSTKKIHKPTCSSAVDMKAENKQEYTGSIENLLADGYTKCRTCKPE